MHVNSVSFSVLITGALMHLMFVMEIRIVWMEQMNMIAVKYQIDFTLFFFKLC